MSNTIQALRSGNIYTNTRGILLRADIASKLSVESYFYENQSRFPRYLNEFIEDQGVVPGQGRPKDFKADGYDYAQSGGYISYAPFKQFNFQAGQHKHFIGDGYRSMFLSDNSFNYPFARFNFWFLKNRINYSVMYASFQNLDRLPTPASSESPFMRKGGTFHHLQFQATAWLRLNLFQGMIWKTMDTNGRSDVDYNMFNPIMFINPAISGLDGDNKTVLGLGFKADAGKKLSFYGQYAIENSQLNKNSWQVGTYFFILRNLRLQTEVNFASPFSYTAPEGPDQRNAYTHYNQALAHPLGTGFIENVIRLNYRWRRLMGQLAFNYAEYDGDGSDIFNNQPSMVINGIPVKYSGYRKNVSLELSYLLNPAVNTKVFLSYSQRYEMQRSSGNWSPYYTDNFIYFGLRTDLRNLYYDF